MLEEREGWAAKAEQYGLPLSQIELKMHTEKKWLGLVRHWVELAGACRPTHVRDCSVSIHVLRLSLAPIWHLLIGDLGSWPHTGVEKYRPSIRFLDDAEDDSSRKRAH